MGDMRPRGSAAQRKRDDEQEDEPIVQDEDVNRTNWAGHIVQPQGSQNQDGKSHPHRKESPLHPIQHVPSREENPAQQVTW